METNYGAGDTVMTPNGRGVVAAALTEEFEFPQESDAVVEVPANGDTPAYVVGLEAGGAAVYRDETIEPATFDNEGLPSISGSAETEVVDETIDTSLPEEWEGRTDLLQWWSSVGDIEAGVSTLAAEGYEEAEAKQRCTELRDLFLRTTRWRDRF